ncbi:MAG: type II toxin-antitoxin system Phd/YefM family antitoxin [Anaerolineae bacterium]
MTDEVTVGVRELKTHLSRYIGMAKKGETVIVTERGTPVAQLQPLESHPDDVRQRLLAAVKAGVLNWNGRRLEPYEPVIVNKGPKLVSDILIEDRE